LQQTIRVRFALLLAGLLFSCIQDKNLKQSMVYLQTSTCQNQH